MRTKQLRLNDPALIRQRLPEFVGKKINIVLRDNTVSFGELKKITADEIVLENMRLEKMYFAFQSITEIYLDTKV
jgi:hypothetical protein